VPCTTFTLYDVNKYRYVEVKVRGHFRSFEMTPFNRLQRVPIGLSLYRVSLSCKPTFTEINVKSFQ